jgi:hypothetical protein
MKAAKKQAPVSVPVPELDTPRYLLGDAAAAAGVTPITLKAWLSTERSVVPLGPYDQPGRGKGVSRLLTLRRIYAIAITAELVSLGFAASEAGRVGFSVAARHAREFIGEHGGIFLAANPSRDHFAIFDSPEVSMDELLLKKGAPPTPDGSMTPMTSCAVIDCGALLQRVQTRLKERGV